MIVRIARHALEVLRDSVVLFTGAILARFLHDGVALRPRSRPTRCWCESRCRTAPARHVVLGDADAVAVLHGQHPRVELGRGFKQRGRGTLRHRLARSREQHAAARALARRDRRVRT
jgi:hypothetical protein